MDDTISRAAAIDALADYIHNVDKVYSTGKLSMYDCKDAAASVFEELPSAQPDCADCKKHGGDWECDYVHCHKGESAQPKRKKGKWKDRKVFDTKGTGIVEMQSAKCSKCGRYHTTPYLYFFDDFNFCPNCGADMRRDADV